MAYKPKLNHIAGACALLFCINAQSFAQTETQLSPVVVTGEKGTGYVAKGAMIGGPGGTEEVALKDIPASVTVISKDLLDDRQARVMSEAAKLDASIGDYYAAMGYYENLYIRGFPLDPATSYRINGMQVTGEQNIAFENKERLEILKGVGAMQAGAASPGGLINYVTKRPKDVQSFTVGTGERGTRYMAADFGTFLNKEKSLGIRINAANENIRPYVKDAKGERQFFSLAADAKISSKTMVKFDFEVVIDDEEFYRLAALFMADIKEYDLWKKEVYKRVAKRMNLIDTDPVNAEIDSKQAVTPSRFCMPGGWS